jgi:hypothetical protein
MKTIKIYEKPMCCSTGVCGPQVDTVLLRFANDIEWLRSQGYPVARYNLAHQPQAFLDNPEVQRAIKEQGTEVLPLVLIDDRLVCTMGYPSREALSALLNNATANVLPLQTGNDSHAASAKQGASLPVSSLPVSSLPVSTLPVSKPAAEEEASGGGCCGRME